MTRPQIQSKKRRIRAEWDVRHERDRRDVNAYYVYRGTYVILVVDQFNDLERGGSRNDNACSSPTVSGSHRRQAGA